MGRAGLPLHPTASPPWSRTMEDGQPCPAGHAHHTAATLTAGFPLLPMASTPLSTHHARAAQYFAAPERALPGEAALDKSPDLSPISDHENGHAVGEYSRSSTASCSFQGDDVRERDDAAQLHVDCPTEQGLGCSATSEGDPVVLTHRSCGDNAHRDLHNRLDRVAYDLAAAASAATALEGAPTMGEAPQQWRGASSSVDEVMADALAGGPCPWTPGEGTSGLLASQAARSAPPAGASDARGGHNAGSAAAYPIVEDDPPENDNGGTEGARWPPSLSCGGDAEQALTGRHTSGSGTASRSSLTCSGPLPFDTQFGQRVGLPHAILSGLPQMPTPAEVVWRAADALPPGSLSTLLPRHATVPPVSLLSSPEGSSTPTHLSVPAHRGRTGEGQLRTSSTSTTSAGHQATTPNSCGAAMPLSLCPPATAVPLRIHSLHDPMLRMIEEGEDVEEERGTSFDDLLDEDGTTAIAELFRFCQRRVLCMGKGRLSDVRRGREPDGSGCGDAGMTTSPRGAVVPLDEGAAESGEREYRLRDVERVAQAAAADRGEAAAMRRPLMLGYPRRDGAARSLSFAGDSSLRSDDDDGDGLPGGRWERQHHTSRAEGEGGGALAPLTANTLPAAPVLRSSPASPSLARRGLTLLRRRLRRTVAFYNVFASASAPECRPGVTQALEAHHLTIRAAAGATAAPVGSPSTAVSGAACAVSNVVTGNAARGLDLLSPSSSAALLPAFTSLQPISPAIPPNGERERVSCGTPPPEGPQSSAPTASSLSRLPRTSPVPSRGPLPERSLERVAVVYVALQYLACAMLAPVVVTLALVTFQSVGVATVQDGTACNLFAFRDVLRPDLSFSLVCFVVNSCLAVRCAVQAVRYERGGLLVVQGVTVLLQVSRAVYFLLFVVGRYVADSTELAAGRTPSPHEDLQRRLLSLHSVGAPWASRLTFAYPSVTHALLVFTWVGLVSSALCFTMSAALTPWVYASFGWRRYTHGIVRANLTEVHRRRKAVRTCEQLDCVITANMYFAAAFLMDSSADQWTLLLVTVAVFALYYALVPTLRYARHWWPLLCTAGVLVCLSCYHASVIGWGLHDDDEMRSMSRSPWHSACYTAQLPQCLQSVSSQHPVIIYRDSSPGHRTRTCSSVRRCHADASGRRSAVQRPSAPTPSSRWGTTLDVLQVRNDTDTYLPTHGALSEYFRILDCDAVCFRRCEEENEGEGAEGGRPHFFTRRIGDCCARYGRCRLKDAFRTYAVLLLLVLLLGVFMVRVVLLTVAWRSYLEDDDGVAAAFALERWRYRSGGRRLSRGASGSTASIMLD